MTRWVWGRSWAGALFWVAAAAQAEVYKCPGSPVLYTDQLSAQEARDKGCRTIEGTPITVIQGRPARTAAGTPTSTPPSGQPSGQPSAGPASRPGESRVEPAAQRARDTDAKRILGDELAREEERLAVLRKEFNNGEPERRGDERNYQRYIDRVAEMKASILRKESDVAALKRELAKLPQ